MYMPINPLGYSCIKKIQRDNLWHAYNEPINFYSVKYISVLDETGNWPSNKLENYKKATMAKSDLYKAFHQI